MIYLYVKTHNITGLKYFGKTKRKDVISYQGSGTHWKRHIKKYGYDVTTEIIGIYEDADSESCRNHAVKFSLDNDIVESKEWANLKIECLDGGFDHIHRLPAETKRSMFLNWWNNLDEHTRNEINEKKGNAGSKNGMYGVHRYGEAAPGYGVIPSEEKRKKISEKNKGKCCVKDSITGEIIGRVDINHDKIVSGEWVSINVGKTRSDEWKENRSLEYKRKGIRPSFSPKGKLWWNNGTDHIRSEECPGDGYVRGRLYFNRKRKVKP